MKALVTGGDGFIGSHLIERLVKEGIEVTVLVREKDNELEKQSLEVALRSIDVVFHLAAIARPLAIKEQEYFNANEIGTKNLLEACLDKKIKKIIVMSSVSAVGMSMDGNAVNEKTLC